MSFVAIDTKTGKKEGRMGHVPSDAIGIVIDFTSSSPAEAARLSLVCRRWNEAFTFCSDDMWTRFVFPASTKKVIEEKNKKTSGSGCDNDAQDHEDKESKTEEVQLQVPFLLRGVLKPRYMAGGIRLNERLSGDQVHTVRAAKTLEATEAQASLPMHQLKMGTATARAFPPLRAFQKLEEEEEVSNNGHTDGGDASGGSSSAAAPLPLSSSSSSCSRGAAAELHPIEDCDFAFRCPLFAEKMHNTGRVSKEFGNPILHCDVCSRDVFVIRSEEERQLFGKQRKECILYDAEDTQHLNKKAILERKRRQQQQQRRGNNVKQSIFSDRPSEMNILLLDNEGGEAAVRMAVAMRRCCGRSVKLSRRKDSAHIEFHISLFSPALDGLAVTVVGEGQVFRFVFRIATLHSKEEAAPRAEALFGGAGGKILCLEDLQDGRAMHQVYSAMMFVSTNAGGGANMKKFQDAFVASGIHESSWAAGFGCGPLNSPGNFSPNVFQVPPAPVAAPAVDASLLRKISFLAKRTVASMGKSFEQRMDEVGDKLLGYLADMWLMRPKRLAGCVMF